MRVLIKPMLLFLSILVIYTQTTFGVHNQDCMLSNDIKTSITVINHTDYFVKLHELEQWGFCLSPSDGGSCYLDLPPDSCLSKNHRINYGKIDPHELQSIKPNTTVSFESQGWTSGVDLVINSYDKDTKFMQFDKFSKMTRAYKAMLKFGLEDNEFTEHNFPIQFLPGRYRDDFCGLFTFRDVQLTSDSNSKTNIIVKITKNAQDIIDITPLFPDSEPGGYGGYEYQLRPYDYTIKIFAKKLKEDL